MTDIRIGTSGFHYKHWIGRYYPADIKPGGMLAHYLRDFDTVELNNTFYQLPKEESFDTWRTSTPHDFLFAVKARICGTSSPPVSKARRCRRSACCPRPMWIGSSATSPTSASAARPSIRRCSTSSR